MEGPQAAPLDVSYKQHTRASSGPNTRQHSHRWPLRVVDDNSPTHPSTCGSSDTKSAKDLAAPDCLYTTSPSAYYSGAQHQPPRPRRYLVDAGCAGRLKSTAYEEGNQAFERKNLRSYRDTTSEIISLYAASNPQAYVQMAAGGLSDATREYSTSAATSRHIVTQRPSTAMHSSASTGRLQRPRSPAPYPARLRRPGYREVSSAAAEDGLIDYTRTVEPERPSQAPYKTMYAHGPRRPPPLALRPDMNRSTTSLPSGPSPGPSHFGTASGRARTPSSSVSWASRPSDRYCGGSTDPSIRSASLTSIVEMYQRPMTGPNHCPPMRSTGMLYYDYSEEFKRQTTARADLDAPVCPIPKRTGSNEQPLILREDTLSRLDSIASSVGGSGNGSNNNMGTRGRDLNSIDEFCDSYMEDSHGESIREIEKVLANAISSVAADQSLMSTLRAADARYSQRLFGPASVKPATVRNGPDTATSSSSNDWAIPQKAWRQSKTVAAEPGYALSQAGNRSSQASLCKKDFSLDPVFADFTSLLSSFERLAKSPFSRLSDEDDLDEENKHLSRRLTLELLDRVAAESKPYQRCHRRNRAARDIRISELSGDDSLSGNRISSEGTTVLAPEPLSPSRQPPTKNVQDLQLMKALPPLPGERLPRSCADENQASQTGVDNVRQASPKGLETGKDRKPAEIAKSPLVDKKAHRQSPLKLKLRVNASRSSIDADTPDTYGARSRRNSVDEGRLPSTSKAPPRLKLKVSRTQLNQGRNNSCETIIRNNRLKQCNALADVAPPPRLGGSCQPGGGEEKSADAESPQKAGTLDIIEDEARQSSPGTLSDQFSLVYPPTPPDTVEAGIQNSTSTGKLIVELPASHSDIGHVPSRRLRSKFSFLRPRNTTAAGPALTADETNADMTLHARDRAASMEGPNQFFGKVATAASTSAKSERVGVKMRRWATDAKRAVRLYVRRTLVRGPKKANQEVQA